MMKKEYRQFLRDRRTLAISFGIPLVIIIIFGVGFGELGEVEDVSIALVNEDTAGNLSWDVVEEFEKSKMLHLSVYYSSIYDAKEAIKSGRVMGAVIIPSSFSEGISTSGVGSIIFLFDNTKLFLITLHMLSEVHAISAKLSQQYFMQLYAQTRQVSVLVETVDIPVFGGLTPIKCFSPLLVGLVIQQIGIMMTAVSVTREKERGTFEQLIVTPVTSTEFLLSKFLLYLIVSTAVALVMFEVLISGFDLPLHGSMPDAIALTILMSCVSVGLGLVIAVRSTNQMQAIQIGSFLMIPTLFFSGTFMPLEMMAPYARFLVYLNPVYHYSNSLNKFMTSGIGLMDMPGTTLGLLLFTITTIGLSVKAFTKKVK